MHLTFQENLVNVLQHAIKKRVNTARRKQLFPEKRRNKVTHIDGTDADYGLAEPLIESNSLGDIEKKKIKFLESLYQANLIQIEEETRQQCGNDNWC